MNLREHLLIEDFASPPNIYLNDEDAQFTGSNEFDKQ